MYAIIVTREHQFGQLQKNISHQIDVWLIHQANRIADCVKIFGLLHQLKQPNAQMLSFR